nr:Retrovirus-related Pol polyprotein from transposon TNT 1-94 [Ipomoea trifida]
MQPTASAVAELESWEFDGEGPGITTCSICMDESDVGCHARMSFVVKWLKGDHTCPVQSSFVQPAVPKFDGHYDHWAMLMENFLRSKEYWIVVENEIPAAAEGGASSEAERKRIEGLKLTDLKAKNYLFQALDRSILETILKKDTAKNIWDSMKQKFQGATRVKNSHLQALRKEFEILEMKIGESVNEYFARTLSIVNKMNANGETKSDADVVSKILRSMTSKFNYVVCSIEESKDTNKLTIDELQSSLLVHEQRMNMNSLAEEAQALKISFSDQSNARGRGRGSYRGRGRGRGRQSFDKATIECYKCHKLGHFQWECSSKEANYVETEEEIERTDYGYEDGSKSNVQTTCGDCPVYLFQYNYRSKSSALALQIWALELQWSKDTSAKEYGERFAGTWFFLSNLQGLYGGKATTNKCENAGVCDLEWGDQEIDVPEPGEGDSVNESDVVTDIEKCTPDVSTSADLPDQVADVMTKPLKVDQFCKLRKSMGVCAEAGIN